MIVQRNRRQRRPGQALVEFAFCLPILLFIFGVAVDYGWTMYLQVSLHAAVRDGALLAIYDGTYTSTQIQNRVITSFQPGTLTASNVTVNLAKTMTIAGTTYKSFDIKANYTWNFLVLFVFYPEAKINLFSEQQSIIVSGFTP